MNAAVGTQSSATIDSTGCCVVRDIGKSVDEGHARMAGRSQTGAVSIFFVLNLFVASGVSAADKPAANGWSATIVNEKSAFSQTGVASFYSADGPTASGMKTKPEELTAAHRSLPFGSKLKVQHLKNGREVVVTITDRGPFKKGRVIDVSVPAAEALGIVDQGVAPVRLTLME
jgi:rare lipoprotein A